VWVTLKNDWGRVCEKSNKTKKLADGKTLGGRGRLTDARIDKITTYYGNAIKGKHNLQGMRKVIWAIYFHYNSTDKDPVHNLCDVSWCAYLQAKRDKTLKTFKHKSSIPYYKVFYGQKTKH